MTARAERIQMQGNLQNQVMHILWRKHRASVEEVRKELPARKRGAYTTVQTVLNRLAERGLLSRERSGKTFFYTPAISEAEYFSRSLSQALAGASDQARRAALAALVSDLGDDELSEIRSLAGEVERRSGTKL